MFRYQRLIRLKRISTQKYMVFKILLVASLSLAYMCNVHKRNEKSQHLLPQSSSMNATQMREDETHHIFRSARPSLTRRDPMGIRAYDSMSDDCVEQWVVFNDWGSACIGTDLSDGLRLDGVWTWVNGSDPLQIAARQYYRPSSKMKMTQLSRAEVGT